MKIEHAAIWVRDLEDMKDFYCAFFKGTAGAKYRNEKTGFESYFIAFDGGARLELMTRPDIGSADALAPFCGFAHLAFSTGSEKEVDLMTNVLRAAGCRISSEPRRTGDGYYESCILDPEGNSIEITS